jgi:hypothetical protein
VKLHLSPEQLAQRRRTLTHLFWANAALAAINLTLAWVFLIIPCFFAGGICALVALLLWDHA